MSWKSLLALSATIRMGSSIPLEQEVLRQQPSDDIGTPLPLVIWHGLGDEYDPLTCVPIMANEAPVTNEKVCDQWAILLRL